MAQIQYVKQTTMKEQENKNQAVIVLSGYNIKAVIAFCRWATSHGVKFHIIATGPEDPIYCTEYKKHVFIERDSQLLVPKQFRSWIEMLCGKEDYHRILILPTTEYLNRFLLDHRDVIEASDCIIPLVSKKLYQTISNKHDFTALCRSYNLEIPKEYDSIPERFPFVAKPNTYLSAKGKQLVPHLIKNKTDLKLFRNEDESDFFFQEFVYGKSLYLLAYIGIKDNILYSQENLIQQANGGSIILAKRSEFHNNNVADDYMRMFNDLSFTGLIMVEVRLDPVSEKYYMIEANPRLWGPLQFVIDNNIDLLGAMLHDYGFNIYQSNNKSTPTTHYFWSGGLTLNTQPVAYHSYSASDFINEFPVIRSQDIFFRKDTFKLFNRESGIREKHEVF